MLKEANGNKFVSYFVVYFIAVFRPLHMHNDCDVSERLVTELVLLFRINLLKNW
jgi:hypothetical protein